MTADARIELETSSREAFQRLSAGVALIDRYRTSRAFEMLDLAEQELERSLEKDQTYLAPRYYLAVLYDLKGKAKDAVEQLSFLRPQLSAHSVRLAKEIQYNLAVAHYHQYSHEHLRQADDELADLLNQELDQQLRAACLALRVQVHAMWEIPRCPTDLTQDDLANIQSHYQIALTTAREAVTYCRPTWRLWRYFGLTKSIRHALEATVLNGIGMARMYFSDYFLTAREKLLRKSLRDFERADRLSPKDWANYCDIGSCYLRLGVSLGEPSYFVKARSRLQEVINTLRPEYGFALYEVGRTFRCEGRFGEALNWYRRSLEVSQDYRDVSDRRVGIEISRTERGDSSFP